MEVGTNRLESSLEEVVGKEVSSQVHKVVHDVDPPVLGVAVAEGGLDVTAAWVDGEHEGQAEQGRDQGREQKVDDRSQRNHSVHFGI